MTATNLTEEIEAPWDSDHTALVHVLWGVEHKGLTKADEVAEFIMQSKWYRAVKQHAIEAAAKHNAQLALYAGPYI